jgi:hypothetical protein
MSSLTPNGEGQPLSNQKNTDFKFFYGGALQVGFSVNDLFHVVNDATISAKAKLLQIKARRSAVSIGDMFEMQMLMNHLSQLSEMSSDVISAANSAIMSMARNVKG